MLKAHDLWFGSEDSLLAVFTAVERLEALEAQGESAVRAKVAEMWAGRGGAGEDPFGLPPLWAAEDGVAILGISGSLIPGYAGFFRLFGLTGYADIEDAAAELAANNDVKSVMLHIDSGGGHVNGVEGAGDAIRALAEIKPVMAFTDGDMMSAAYWLGSSADKLFASKTAAVGSVGTLMVHTEYSKQLEMQGVTKTITRSGKFKALSNPFEPLTAEAKAERQAMADEASSIFVEYVSDRRGVTPEKFQKTMGEGRVFMGRPAHDVGLIDGVMSFKEMTAMMKKLDKVKMSTQNSRNKRDSTMKATLATALVLQLIAGAAVESLDLTAAAATAEGVEPDAEAQAALKAQAEEIAGSLVATRTTDSADLTAQVQTLQASLDTVKSENAVLKAATQTLTAEKDVAIELSDAMSLILRDSISVMSVALQGAKDAGKDLTGQALLDEHARLAGQFKSKFPTGGVAAVGVVDEPTERQASTELDDPIFLHAVQSLRSNRK